MRKVAQRIERRVGRERLAIAADQKNVLLRVAIRDLERTLTAAEANALRDAIKCCRSGGTVSVIGVYSGFIDKFPMGSVMNRSLRIMTGQCHVQRYMKPLLERVRKGEIDPSFVITHRAGLDDAPSMYRTFRDKQDECLKVVLKP